MMMNGINPGLKNEPDEQVRQEGWLQCGDAETEKELAHVVPGRERDVCCRGQSFFSTAFLTVKNFLGNRA